MLTLLQAADPGLSVRAADVLQAITAAGMVGVITFLWRLGPRLTRIETILLDKDMGLSPQVTSLRKSRHNDANVLQQHETRLDGHDRDIERLDSQSERRAAKQQPQPFDGRRAAT